MSLAATAMGFMTHESILSVSISISTSTAVFLLCSSLLRGLNFPKTFATVTLYIQVFALLCMGVAATEHGLLVGTAVYVGLSAAPVLVVHLLTHTHKSFATKSEVSRVLTLAISLVPHLVMAVATMLLMRVLVGFSLGTAAAANYMFASLLIGGALTVGASLDAHWSTRAQVASTSGLLSQILVRNQARIQVALLLVSLAVTLFIFLALDTWLPSTYDRQGVVGAVAMGLPAAALQAAADGRSALLMWLGRTLQISVATATGGLTTLALALVLLPSYGWQTAGLCITAGMAARAILATLFSFKAAGFRRFDLYVGITLGLQAALGAALFFK
ncbi:hypothetical protein [Sinomonas sp. P47F7]|uniref:hypothetical protein n=1 Tax=Sinomonas sp. P47F7 TaxID=3410987 RepID=UPI003BF46264